MKKVLELVPHPFWSGGIESFIGNIIKNIENDDLSIDLYTPYYADNEYYKRIIESKGGHLYHENEQFVPGFNQFKAFRRTIGFLKNKNYDVIHIHSSSSFSLAFYSIIASMFHTHKIIVHSHNTGEKKDIKFWLIRIFSLTVFALFPTDFFACSMKAAEWKFSKHTLKKKVKIIKNGIDLNKFKINDEIRNIYRNKHSLSEDDLVIGHVGRFVPEKNHKFIIDLFTELKKKNDRYKLILIGDGEQKSDIESYAKEKNVYESIIFTGNIDNVQDYLQAMDLFILPSIYEGLPIVGVEAQACGLPFALSSGITEELKITENVDFISLDNMELWINTVEKRILLPKINNAEMIRSAGYDIKESADKLMSYYLD